MNKSMKTGLLFLAAALVLVSVFFWGAATIRRDFFPRSLVDLVLPRRAKTDDEKAEKPSGRFRKARDRRAVMTEEELAELNKLGTLPYLQGYHLAGEKSGVLIHDRDRAFSGLNFYCSGHEPAAYLMDMDGKVLHSWEKKFSEVWPKDPGIKASRSGKNFFRRAAIMPDGGLVAIFEGYGVIRLDRDSNLIWKNLCQAHHDLFIHENGDIYVLTRKFTDSNEVLNIRAGVLLDYVTVISPEGSIKKEISILDCFLDSDFSAAMYFLRDRGDIMHTNSILLFDGRAEKAFPAFKEGRALISIRETHTVAVIDLEMEKTVWAMSGMWLYQHDPSVLDNGNLLVFDNRGGYENRSKVIELDPTSNEVVWSYRSGPENDFYSRTCGTAERLPNGNTLITESDYGRAFEVTRDGEIVWEFINPHRAGENDELVATLFEMKRIPRDEVDCGESPGSCFKKSD